MRIPLVAQVEFRASGTDSDDSVPTFEMSAYTGGFVNLPDYELPVVFDLSTLKLQENASQVPLLFEHDELRGVGHFDVSITAEGVTGTGYLSEPGPDNDRVVASARAGKEWQLSVGVSASMDSVEEIPDGQPFQANNRTLHGPALLVRGGLLRETSFVQAGADRDGAIATLVASLRSNSTGAETMGFEAWVAEQGFELDKLTAKQLSSLRAQYEAQGNNLTDPDDIVPDEESAADESSKVDEESNEPATVPAAADDIANSAADEVDRVAEIQRVAASYPAEALTIERNGETINLQATALRERQTPAEFERDVLRNSRPQRMNASRGGRRSSDTPDEMLSAMVLSIMASVNARTDFDFRGNQSAMTYFQASGARGTMLADPEDAKRYRIWEASNRYRGASLFDMMASLMDAHDIDYGGAKGTDAFFKAAFASNTVVDLFTTSAQAVLLDTFMQNAATYDQLLSIARQVDVPNFKTNERKTVSPDSGEMEQLNPTGTAGDAHLTSSGETYSIARYAKKWGIDDQDMIDEEFGVFQEMPMFLGMQAAQLAGQVVCKLLLSNPNMADGSAWCSGTSVRNSSALTNANMKAALTAFGTQTDGSVTLDLRPDTLVVPSALQFTAAETLDAAPLITGNTTTQTSRNVLAGRISRIIDTALIDNGFNDPADRSTAIAGNSTSWWLFDSRYPAIEVGHLRGTGRGPTVRTGTYENGKYGVWFDVKRDIGAAPLRRESAQRNNA